MKYIFALLILLSGILLYINKDSLLSKYSTNNLATVSESDYVEPVRNLGKVKVSVEKSTSTTGVTPTNVVSSNIKTSYGDQYRSIWTHFIDNKPYTNLNQVYFWGENVTYYFTDWDSMNKFGFFLGWINENTNSIFRGSDKWSEYTFAIWRNTEVVSKYQNCARPFPEHVFFKNVNALERKLVQFANNKGDAKLKINAKGEVGALAVVYGDGAVCARFTEGKIIDGEGGGVQFMYTDINNFYSSYKYKSIKKYLMYHTHDYNSEFKSALLLAYSKNNKPVKFIGTVISPGDLDAAWQTYKVFEGQYKIEERVVSSAGNGYYYNIPKGSKVAEDDGISAPMQSMILESISYAKNDSMEKGKRKKPTAKDIQAAIDFAINTYKNDLGVSIKFFTVK